MHKSYFHGSVDDYIQVVSHKDQDAQLKAMGFVDHFDKLGEQVAQDEPQTINLRDAIEDCQDKSELEQLMKSAKGVDLDKRKSLDNMKADALKVLNES